MDAMPIEITLDIPDELLAALSAAFPEGKPEDVAKHFSEVALRHFAAWITGNRRYRSLTEQYIDWVEDLYTTLMPSTDPPNADRLYNRFNISYGNAQYISRVLSNKRLVHWRKKAFEELADAIESLVPEALRRVKARDEHAPMVLRTTRLPALELAHSCDEICARDREFELPRSKRALGEQRVYEIEAKSIVDIDNYLKGLTKVLARSTIPLEGRTHE
jgi:hypothetical protein